MSAETALLIVPGYGEGHRHFVFGHAVGHGVRAEGDQQLDRSMVARLRGRGQQGDALVVPGVEIGVRATASISKIIKHSSVGWIAALNAGVRPAVSRALTFAPAKSSNATSCG